ncbi:MAG TPA: PD-(D/E)XK nuclease family protein [Gaiella sp.]|nr:PD-(D/E)XK nuclease family protein [Gaiella sp.]
MGLSLVVGPAHAGKVALLLDRFVATLDRDPWLVVPNRSDVDRAERELVRRCDGLLSGTVGTFDTLFEALAAGRDGRPWRLLGDAERHLILRRVVDEAAPPGSRHPGFADALARAISELDGALAEPDDLSDPLSGLVRRYHAELERLHAWDRGALRRHAIRRLTGDLDAWDGRPVLAHGFEDLTAAEWRLLEALAARTEVHVSLPYEPGRAAYASLSRSANDLAALAGPSVVELPAKGAEYLPPALAHLERALFSEAPGREALDGAIRFLEGAGTRGTLELVAEEILALVRAGTTPEEIAVVCPSVDAARVPLEAAFAAVGVPVAIEGRLPLRATPFGASLLALLRFAWLGGERPQLYAHLRSPYSGVPRRDVDWVEGKLRGRGILRGDRTVEVTDDVRSGRTLPLYDLAVGEAPPIGIVRLLSDAMLRNAHGTAAPPTGPQVQSDLRAHDAVTRTLDELEALGNGGAAVERLSVLASLERADVRGDRPGSPGRVAVLDLLRVRTRRYDTVFVLGLEQGTLPRRARVEPFLDEDERRRLDERHGGRLLRPEPASRDRYLFATACTRPTRRLVLVRQAVGDEGTPREPSPFWEAVKDVFDPDDVRHHTTRRPLSSLTRELEAAPTERERLRALARLAVTAPSEARALARANGWERRLRRATTAFERPTELTHERALRLLGSREAYSVSELERMASCSSAWFVERYLRPATIDKEIDRMMRGSILHAALQRFYQQLPSAIPGAERVDDGNVEAAVALVRDCVVQAVESGLRIDAGDLDRRELEQSLQRDLEQLVRDEAASPSPFVPRHLEVSFRSYELAQGVVVSGKIDRVDGDPMGARGIVVDYKSGAASSASEIRERALLQLPLYMLVLRDQLGLEPVGGIYVPVGGGRRPRGMLRSGDDGIPGFSARDYLDHEEFEEAVERARETAVGLVERIRAGDVRHDPQGGDCPHWCDLWRVCRKERA